MVFFTIPRQYHLTLWLFNIAMEAMALIEIDDFPIKNQQFIYGIFHGYVSHNQRVIPP